MTDSFLFWMSSCKTVFSEATVLLAVGSVVAGCSGLPSGKTLPYSQKVDCLSSLLIIQILSPAVPDTSSALSYFLLFSRFRRGFFYRCVFRFTASYTLESAAPTSVGNPRCSNFRIILSGQDIGALVPEDVLLFVLKERGCLHSILHKSMLFSPFHKSQFSFFCCRRHKGSAPEEEIPLQVSSKPK